MRSGCSGARRDASETAGASEKNGVPMRDADAILWALDRDPLLRSTIVAVAVLDRSPPYERVLERLEVLCEQQSHFRSVVISPDQPWGRPRWQEVPGFEAATHLAHVRAALPGDLRSVLDIAQSMGGRPFDVARPLWEGVLVDGMADGGAALVVKMHHSVIDGVGGLKVVGSVLDTSREDSWTPRAERVAGSSPRSGEERETDRTHRHRGPARCAGAALTGVLRRTARVPGVLLGSAREAVQDPVGSVGRWRDAVVDSASLLAPSPSPLSPLMRERGLDRYFETVDLEGADLHGTARRAGLTLNDLFVSGLLDGLSRYHRLHGRPASMLRALMPISTRRPDDPLDTNRFVPVRFTLPAGLADADAYLDQVPRLLTRWKRSTALPVSDLLTAALDLLPPPVVVRTFSSMLMGVDFTATDVPGPPFDPFFAGAKIESFLAFPPTAGAALNAGLVTMAGRPGIGVTVDLAAVPDPGLMRTCLHEGLEAVLAAAERRQRPVADPRPNGRRSPPMTGTG